MTQRYTEEDAVKILNLFYTTQLSMREIADEINCSKNFVVRVVNNKLYTNLQRQDLPNWRY